MSKAKGAASSSSSSASSSSSSTESRPPAQFDDPISEAETQRTFYSVFSLAGMALKSPAEWNEGEFAQLAQAWVDLGNRLPFLEPALRVPVRVLGILASLEQLASKARKLFDGANAPTFPGFRFRRRRPAEDPDQAA